MPTIRVVVENSYEFEISQEKFDRLEAMREDLSVDYRDIELELETMVREQESCMTNVDFSEIDRNG